jgi:hypothetical protein
MIKLAITLCLLITALLQAEPSSGKKVEIRFLAERVPAELGKVQLVSKKEKCAPFDLPISFLSPPLTAPERAFSLFSSEKNLSLANITLPEEGDAFIVLLFPSEKGGFKHVIISDKNANFKAGDFYFYNQANATVMGFVGNAKFTLAPANGTIVRPTKPSGDGAYYDIGLGVREKDGDKPLSVARWPVQKGIRTYVFFFINPRSGKLDFRGVDDFIEPEVAP